MRALSRGVRADAVDHGARRLPRHRTGVEDERCTGLFADAGTSGSCCSPRDRVVFATGGLGALYRDNTNPPDRAAKAWLAARAGAVIADPEFVQFHPTAIDIGRDPAPLVTEALRGEGAILIDETGERFMAASPAPNWRRAMSWRAPSSARSRAAIGVFLDARRPSARTSRALSAIAALCRAAGIDPATQPIPVRPAAHYHMGGIAVDVRGRSSLDGLWACGEAPATGLHGANRLATNSLLEAAVFGALGGRGHRRNGLDQARARPGAARIGRCRRSDPARSRRS